MFSALPDTLESIRQTCIKTECCEKDRNANVEDISVKKDINGSREPTAYTPCNNSTDDEIQTSFVSTVLKTKKPLVPKSKFTYTAGNFVVVKVDREKLKLC